MKKINKTTFEKIYEKIVKGYDFNRKKPCVIAPAMV